MARPAAKFLLGFACIGVGLAVLALFLTLHGPAPGPALPQPNGYDDLAKAGQMLGDEISEAASLGTNELKALLTKAAPALDLARIGLNRECRVPLPASEGGFREHLEKVPGVRRVAQGFAAEGRLAELENRPQDAAKAYLDVIRVGHQAVRGGIIIHGLVGIALENIGLARLEKIAPKLDAPTCRSLAAALEKLEAEREPAATILQQEKAWAWRAYGIRGEVTRVYTWKQLRKTEKGYVGKLNSQAIRSRLLLLQLATLAYQTDKGVRPKSFDDLVPAYIKAPPQDPVTGTNVVFQW